MRVPPRVKMMTPDEWLIIGVLVAAIIASSFAWYSLALRCEFPPALAVVPAIALDLGGLAFGRNWISGRTARLRAWGRVTTIIAVIISIGGNSIEHAIGAGLLPVSLPIVLAVGAIPAAGVFAVAHQWSLRTERPERAPRPVRAAAAATPRPPVTAALVAAPSPGKRALATEWAREHWPVTATGIQRGIAPVSISMTEAARVRDAVAAERREGVAS